jgi:pectate lyase
MTIKGSRHIIIDHCSLTDAGDENIAITQDCRDITISWCLIGDTRPASAGLKPKGVLIANFDKPAVTNVTLHHNLFANESQRSPQVSTPGLFDIRNNVVWDWHAYGIRMRNGARGNIINNVFKTTSSQGRAVIITPDAGPVYVAGNKGPGKGDVNRLSTAPSPFRVAKVLTDPAVKVEQKVLAKAGAWPRDFIDAALVKRETTRPQGSPKPSGGTAAPVGIRVKEKAPDHTKRSLDTK